MNINSGEQRLFVAVGFSIPARRYLASVMERAKRYTVGGSFTPIENFHLTLAFIGETKYADAAVMALENIDFRPFSLQIGGEYGSFRSGNERILWLGMGEGKETLATLADAVTGELRKHGFDLPQRGFSPHITLARRVKDVRIADLSSPGYFRVNVDKISLMRSDRDPVTHRPVYTEIAFKNAK